jgi:hypothetical protein
VQVLVSRGLGEPNSIAVDYYNYEVCWADGGRKEMGITPRIGEFIFTEFYYLEQLRVYKVSSSANISMVQWKFLFLLKI